MVGISIFTDTHTCKEQKIPPASVPSVRDGVSNFSLFRSPIDLTHMCVFFAIAATDFADDTDSLRTAGPVLEIDKIYRIDRKQLQASTEPKPLTL